MKLNARGLAGIITVVAIAGCTVTAPNGPATGGTKSPAPSASAMPSSRPSGTSSATPSASPGSNAIVATANDFATAQMLMAPMAEVMGNVAKDTYFKVTVPGDKLDGMLKVTITENSNDWTPGVTYYTESKSEMDRFYAADTTTTPFKASMAVTAGKSYYLKLTAPPDATNVTFKVEFVPVNDTTERNDDFATAAMLTSGTAQDLIMFAGDQTNEGRDMDYFKVDVPAGKTKVTVKIENKSTAALPQGFTVTLFAPDKSEIDRASTDNDQADLTHSFDVTASGTHYLKVDGAANSDIASRLTVTVE
jgi:hypothetical protein